MISIGALVHAVIVIIVLGLIFWLLWWLLNFINPPEPFKKVGAVILAVAAVLVVISILLSLIGHPIIVW